MILRRIFSATCAVCLGLVGWSSAGRAQPTAEQQAEMILNSARQAFNDNNYPVAVQRYTEFLAKFGGHPQSNSARLALASAYLESPERPFDKALEAVVPVANNGGAPEHPFAAYQAGHCLRGLGLADLAQAQARPADAAQLRPRAEGRFNEASQRFAQSATAFTARFPKDAADPKLVPDLDWAARARCDQAEMEIRLGKYKEARATAEPFSKATLLAKSRYLKLGLYYHGFAAFQLQDYLVAGRSLTQLAPFDDPHNGLHARYLLSRVYHLTEQKAEAKQGYDLVLTGYDQQKKDAAELLKRPDQFRKAPHELRRLEGIVRNPPPDHVAGAVFHSAGLEYEAGRFGESLGKFQQFVKDFPQSGLVPEAQLQAGFCQVQMKSFPEAVATLQPLLDKHPKLADQVQFWIGKSQAGIALANNDPAKVADRENGLRTAVATLRGAADKAGALAQAGDADARKRRSEMLLEAADVMQFAKQYREAAVLYDQLVAEKGLPNRQEEMAQRAVSAWHLAGDPARSDLLAGQFLQQYPESTLRLAVMFRMAENAYFAALTAERAGNRTGELPKLFDDAGKRYSLVIEKGGEFERLSLARYGLAMCHFKRGDFDRALEALEKIPAGDRTGEMSYASYLHADCLLRRAPASVTGAAETRKLLESLEGAAAQLDAFIGGSPSAPEVPGAMLKLGTCKYRIAAVIAVPQERAAMLQQARTIFEQLVQKFPKDAAAQQAVLERARCMALAGDPNGAVNELRRFTNDPLQASPSAPFALTLLSTLLRQQNRSADAVQVMNGARQKYEGTLQKEPEQIALLRYHHGLALQESGKFAEARQALDSIGQVAAGRPIVAEAALRSGQCRIEEGKKLVETARRQIENPALKQDQRTAVENQLALAYAAVTDGAQYLERRAEELKPTHVASDARERMYYDAAWAHRFVAEPEIQNARNRLRIERQRQLQAEADRAAPGGKAATVSLPVVPRKSVPIQPAEQRARTAYQNQTANYGDSLLSVDARFELSELLAEREEWDAAIKLLKDANDVEPRGDKLPSNELIDRIRIRLGACLAAKKELDAALGYFEAVAGNPKSPLVAHGMFRAGEVLLAKGDTAKAIERLTPFRDRAEFHNVPNVSDRAMLRLGQALAKEKKWDASRQTLETMVARFGGSPSVWEGRYGTAWALQNLGQFDPAVQWYGQVAAGTTDELGAMAQLQIGLCRLEQKRYGDAVSAFLIVPYTYDYAELSAAALCEAARALIDDKKPEQAVKLLQKVMKEHGGSPWAKTAQERLDQLPKP